MVVCCFLFTAHNDIDNFQCFIIMYFVCKVERRNTIEQETTTSMVFNHSYYVSEKSGSYIHIKEL